MHEGTSKLNVQGQRMRGQGMSRRLSDAWAKPLICSLCKLLRLKQWERKARWLRML